MKCLAQGESPGVANIAYEKSSAIFVTRLSPRAVYFHTNRSGSVLSGLLYFTLKDVLTEDTSLKFNTFIE